MPRTAHLRISGLVALTLVLLGSVAIAEPKKKIAVLGLEAVVGANGQIDPADTKFAKELTAELRSRANNSKGYDLTKDQRELVDEKLMNNCASEKPECMSPIGGSMGADVVLFGKVANAKGGYKVSLTLVDVRKKTIIGTDPNAVVTTADTRNPGLGGWVREHYRKVTNESGDGTVIITAAGADGGKVFVNGNPKESLRGGAATVSLPEGRYKIGVEADGFKLWEQETVTVTADKTTELKPSLERTTKPPPIDTQIDPNKHDPDNGTTGTTGTTSISTTGSVSTTKSKTVWKVAAGIGLGGAALGTGYIIYSYTKMSAFQDANVVESSFPGKDMNNPTVSQDDCGKGEFSPTMGATMSNAGDLNSKFTAACNAKDRMKWLVPTTIGLAAIGAGALIYVMISSDSTESRPANSGRRSTKKRNFIVTPVVTPDGTGATMRFDW